MKPTLSFTQLETTAFQLVSNALILAPDAPAETLAARIIAEADPVFAAELSNSLMVGFFTKAVRTTRQKQRSGSGPQKPEGFNLLPLRVRIPGRKNPVPLDKLKLWHVVRLRNALEKKYREDAKNRPVLLQVKALEAAMRKPAKKRPDITAGEVLGFDFGE
jgi:hypothetical protein